MARARPSGEEREPGTLVLRVEGPAAIEIQHLADVICERVNRFLGWRAVARHRFASGAAAARRAQSRRAASTRRRQRGLPQHSRPSHDDDLTNALARLGAVDQATADPWQRPQGHCRALGAQAR